MNPDLAGGMAKELRGSEEAREWSIERSGKGWGKWEMDIVNMNIVKFNYLIK